MSQTGADQTRDDTSDHPSDDISRRGETGADRGDPLIDGSVHDGHAEVAPDPAAAGGGARHRDDVAAVESADGRASGETLGTTEPEHQRSRRGDDADPDV